MKKYKRIFEYIQSDYVRYGGNPTLFNILKAAIFTKNHCFLYSFYFRLSSEKNIFRPFARFKKYRISKKYGIVVEAKVGYGLYIGHGFGTLVSNLAIVGNNCNFSQFSTVGSNHGPAAVIGDNVYIGPSVCIVENVRIGNNVTIGAGAVVVKDIPDNATVAGVPAKIISYKDPGRYIHNKYQVKD